MDVCSEDLAELQQLEESLWIAATRFDNEYMDHILAPDFFEFGRSGKVYTREQSLSAPMQAIKAMLPLRDFTFHQLLKVVALITYISKVDYDELQVGNRSSVWIRTDSGWRLKFHQGTPTTT